MFFSGDYDFNFLFYIHLGYAVINDTFLFVSYLFKILYKYNMQIVSKDKYLK